MPSEGAPGPGGGAGRARLDWLRSQGLGVACGLCTVALLGVGSFVLAFTREGASAGVAMDDARAFFRSPSPVHAWFYVLVPVLGLYALNTLLATWYSVTRKWRAGLRSPSAYGAAVMHLAFLVALLAHGLGGFFGTEQGEVVVSRGWSALPGGSEVRLASLEVDALPGGMPREVRAAVETRGGETGPRAAVVGYNQPLSAGLGSDLWLLGEMGRVPVARFAAGPERCGAAEGGSCDLAGLRATLRRVVPPGAFGPQPMAQVRLESAGTTVERWLPPGGVVEMGDAALRLEGIGAEPAVVLRGRHAPGNPWALASAVLLAAGVAMLWRRFLPPRREKAAPDDDVDPEPEAASGD
ncbi:MAG TPA: hypothetical protein VFR85_21775 [Anaeromyxobacteraceae bacterium]|nr:hypothetical protein [Anaeromyxobacteraceae bacterium]